MDADVYTNFLRCELRNRGHSLASIAGCVGVSASLVGKTLKRQRKNAHVLEFVAAVLEVDPAQIWHLNFRGTLETVAVDEEGGDLRKAS